jgi:response regulator of citrate/malate metabolism
MSLCVVKMINKIQGETINFLTKNNRAMEKKRIVLIVDDSKVIVERLMLLLSEMDGIRKILFAYNYREGIKLLSEEKINIALLDIHLPEKSGIDILKFINEKKLGLDLVIMMSDSDTHGRNRELCIALGAEHFIEKFKEFERIGKIVANL